MRRISNTLAEIHIEIDQKNNVNVVKRDGALNEASTIEVIRAASHVSGLETESEFFGSCF